ncbi:MAG: glycosyltransferase family 2 protein [Patescibacteria group bacterium]|nr:glycosyltransferase family 2 protein [Patescibacteria group bacterium]
MPREFHIKVSVILPTYNGSYFIARALQSIITQSMRELEIIVIDDGSTDGTAEIVKRFGATDSRVRYFKNERNLGIQKSLNRGLREAAGKYIARIDDDDEWMDKEKLQKQVDFLDRNTDYVLVGTGAVFTDEEGRELFRFVGSKTNLAIRKTMLSKNCFIHSSVLFRRDLVMRFGGYDESEEMKHVEDYNLWLKLGSVGKLANLPIYGVKFRVRKTSLSWKNKKEQFKKDLKLSKQFRKIYPGYIKGILIGYARIFFYNFFYLLPFKSFILRLYKLF